MREFASPVTSAVDERARVHDDLLRIAGATPQAVLYRRRDRGGWTEVTARRCHADVRAAAATLGAAGVQPGDRVVIWGRTSYGWTVADLALSYLGAVSVAVFDSADASTVASIVAATEAAGIVVDDPARHVQLTSLETSDSDADAESGGSAEAACWHWSEDGSVQAVQPGTGEQARLTDEELDARRDAVSAEDVATLIFTSGTTGTPKGCVLTHRQLCASVQVQAAEFHSLTGPGSATVIALPLAHVFARTVQLIALRTGTQVAHLSDVRHLVEDLAELQPTFLLGVPRLFERLVTTISQRATADGHGRRFDRGVQVAIDVSRARDEGDGDVPLWLRGRRTWYDRTVFAGVRAALGGRLTWALSGGAPLGERLTRFLDGVGITVLEGYGLTETAAAVTANVPGDVRIGTVGRPLPGVRVRVADDGELLVAAPQVFQGYWRDEDATDGVLENGWLHTGDLAEIGREGHVRIIGRRRELLVLASGKQVSPEPFESQLRQHPLVDQCLVVGDGRPYLGALITLDKPAAVAWARERDLPTRRRALVRTDALRAEMQAAVDAVNEEFSPAEAVRRFTVLPVTWSEEGGEVTASQKLRRTRVSQMHGREVEALFTD